MRLSVVFQGGGAKLFDLLAAAEELRNLQCPSLKIDRVSGSSAGAITAAMIATRCNIEDIVAQHEELKGIISKNFSPAKLKPTRALPKLAIGRAIFGEASLRQALIAIFRLGGVDAESPIKDLVRDDFELRITRSNIRAHSTSVIDENSDSPLWRVLADSAAIPFAFRMPTSCDTPEFVDGGLFQNLPARIACKDLTAEQTPLAISFEKRDPSDLRIEGALGYAKALAGSLIDERVEESIEFVKETNVIFLKNRRETFDFQSFLKDPPKKEFDKIRREFRQKFESWKKRSRRIDGPNFLSDHPEDLKIQFAKNNDAILSFFSEVRDTELHVKEFRNDIFFNSFDEGTSDYSKLILEIDGKDNVGTQFLQLRIGASNVSEFGSAEIIAKLNNEDSIPLLALPVRRIGIEKSRVFVVALPRPLVDGDLLRIEKTEQMSGSRDDYLTDGQTFETLTMTPGRTVERAIIAIHFPSKQAPDFFRDADRTNPREKHAFEGVTGIQYAADRLESTSSQGDRYSVVAETSFPRGKDDTSLRFMKIVFHRSV